LIHIFIVRERQGQCALGVGLSEQVFGLLFDGLEGVGAAAQGSGGSSWLASSISALAKPYWGDQTQ
jgi:hypothetical protein